MVVQNYLIPLMMNKEQKEMKCVSFNNPNVETCWIMEGQLMMNKELDQLAMQNQQMTGQWPIIKVWCDLALHLYDMILGTTESENHINVCAQIWDQNPSWNIVVKLILPNLCNDFRIWNTPPAIPSSCKCST